MTRDARARRTGWHRKLLSCRHLVCIGLAAPVVATGAAPPPDALWHDDMAAVLEDIQLSLMDAAAVIGADEGPLAEPDLSAVAADLDAALATIDQILDPQQYPSLDPPDAGATDPARAPATLPEYADDCVTLIKDALDEVRSEVVDHKVIGTHLQTIEHLITRATPHSYRTKAGIE